MKKRERLLSVLSVVCALSVVGMILSLTLGGRRQGEAEFTVPPFEPSAQSGLPETDDVSWSRIYRDGMSFEAYVCGNVTIRDGSADVYFTNAENNGVWLKLRAIDGDGGILGETGLLRPGEYVRTLVFERVPAAGEEIVLKIMAYEPETFRSAGAALLNTTIGG